MVSGYDGTMMGSATYAPGLVGQAFSLNGAGAYVLIGAPAGLGSFPQGLTLEAWVNPGPPPPVGTDNMYAIVSKWGQSAGLDAYGLYVYSPGDSSTKLVAPLAVNGGSDGVGFSGGLPAGSWTHVGATFDSFTGANVLYVNGQQVSLRMRPGTVTESAVNVMIGREEFAICK